MSLRNLKKMKAREAVPGYFVKYVHTPNLTLAYWEIKAGSPLPEHEHPHEQIVNVVEGAFEMTMDGTRYVLEPGKVLVIPPDTRHSGWAVKNCRIIDVFYPARDEIR